MPRAKKSDAAKGALRKKKRLRFPTTFFWRQNGCLRASGLISGAATPLLTLLSGPQGDSSDLLSATNDDQNASGRSRAQGYNQVGSKVLNKDTGPKTAAPSNSPFVTFISSRSKSKKLIPVLFLSQLPELDGPSADKPSSVFPPLLLTF